MYVNFIGTDGSGKDTIFNLIKESYPNALLTREPGGTKEAEIIREIILDADMSLADRKQQLSELSNLKINEQTLSLLNKAQDALSLEGINSAEPFLYAASRSESIENLIRPALQNSIPVLGRRSVACSVAYQGMARGMGMEHIWELNYPIVKDTYPTLEIFFDLPISIAMQRLAGRTEKQDRLDNENEEFFEKVREGYLYYYQHICPYPYIIVDATKTIDEIYVEVKNILLNL